MISFVTMWLHILIVIIIGSLQQKWRHWVRHWSASLAFMIWYKHRFFKLANIPWARTIVSIGLFPVTVPPDLTSTAEDDTNLSLWIPIVAPVGMQEEIAFQVTIAFISRPIPGITATINSGALAREASAAEHHGWENLINYASEKIWLWRNVRTPTVRTPITYM